jgi:radical SAM superfamily enzyme YgiQ (UPF0313 family)
MKVCLISPLIVSELEGTAADRADIVQNIVEPPLGILNLAALLEERGIGSKIFEANHIFCKVAGDKNAETNGAFFTRAVAELQNLEADVFGFGTITGSYPLTVRLAAAAKRAHPDALIIFGGPQATALDTETLTTFPFVDLIVRGEADQAFPQLLYAIRNSEPLAGQKGITYRHHGNILRSPNSPVVKDLDRLPMPAYHLWPGIQTIRSVSLEAGRGCPFDCTFCSSSPFFRRQYRMKKPGRVIEQMKSLHKAYGIDSFYLVHDTFTARREDAVVFCKALLESGETFKWTCSARTDCVDEELIELMAEAGCNGIFFGVETGSARMQKAIGKKLDPVQALAAIRNAECNKIGSTVSMIIGFPDETPEDVRATVHFLMDSLRFDTITGQIHLLVPVAGSSLYDQFRGKLQWDGIFSDLTVQNWRQDLEDYALIKKYPEVFPDFYAFPSPFLDHRHLADIQSFIIYGIDRFRWLMIALHQFSGDILDVFERWLLWRAHHQPAGKANNEYYANIEFRNDFLEFAGFTYLSDDNPDAIAVAALLEYEIEQDRISKDKTTSETTVSTTNDKPVADLQAIPCLAPGVSLLRLHADFEGIMERLRNRKSMNDVSRNPVLLASRPMPGEYAEIIQLSPLSAVLIELCDGKRTAGEIAELFPRLQKGLDRLPPQQACLFAINELASQHLILRSTTTQSV